VWDRMVPALLAHGTTTAAYFGSTHEIATTALAETCVRHGQRALVGRVAMDHPDGTPDWYRDGSASESVAASARSIEAVLRAAGETGLVRPIITPRFIPACSDAALTGLGELAEATGVLVQTHCSESEWEHAHVLERCGTTDTRALERFGLLRDRTVLAHATHLVGDDRALIAARGAGIAHCPLSNVYFADRPFAARAAMDAGIRLGLGTDIAGGPSPSLMAQCGHAVSASQRLVDDGMSAARIAIVAAFWMATVGGADLLGVDAGLLAPGRHFDALAVSLHRGTDGTDQLDDSPERRFERLVRLTGPADIVEVWVGGRSVVHDGPSSWQI
ncbi:MAG: amidohydrolase family protein, partial [Ilumatobacteraceae bacterium]